MSYWYNNRLICDVLEEMRTCNKTRNYSVLESLIEEAQIMANRMENGLDMKRQIKEMYEERGKLKQEINDLTQKRDRLKLQVKGKK